MEGRKTRTECISRLSPELGCLFCCLCSLLTVNFVCLYYQLLIFTDSFNLHSPDFVLKVKFQILLLFSAGQIRDKHCYRTTGACPSPCRGAVDPLWSSTSEVYSY